MVKKIISINKGYSFTKIEHLTIFIQTNDFCLKESFNKSLKIYIIVSVSIKTSHFSVLYNTAIQLRTMAPWGYST